MTSPIRDILDLLHEDWIPENVRKDLQSLMLELIENMIGHDKIGDRFKWQ